MAKSAGDVTGMALRLDFGRRLMLEFRGSAIIPCVGRCRPAKRVVVFYNQRGTAKQWIKEGKGVSKWTRLSCRYFAANAVRLPLHAPAYGSRPRHLRSNMSTLSADRSLLVAP